MERTEFGQIGAELVSLLHLENPPVAVSFVETPPAGLKKNSEAAPSGCVFWIRAFKESFYTDMADHANCNIGSFTHGFLPPEDVSLDSCLDVALFDKTGYFPSSDFRNVYRLDKAPKYVAYGPLTKAEFEPDVVLMVCNPQQAMLVGEAAGKARLMGAPTCAALPMSFKEGEVGISLGCITNRIRTGIKPNELVVSIPKGELRPLAGRLRSRVRANNEVAQAVTTMLASFQAK